MKRIACIALVSAFAFGFVSLAPSSSFGEIDKDNFEAQQAYRRYVEAWKLKDIAALETVISSEYMTVDFHGNVSNKENEIATAKADAEWTLMLALDGNMSPYSANMVCDLSDSWKVSLETVPHEFQQTWPSELLRHRRRQAIRVMSPLRGKRSPSAEGSLPWTGKLYKCLKTCAIFFPASSV